MAKRRGRIVEVDCPQNQPLNHGVDEIITQNCRKRSQYIRLKIGYFIRLETPIFRGLLLKDYVLISKIDRAEQYV